MSENYLTEGGRIGNGLFGKNMRGVSSMFKAGNPKAHLFPHHPRRSNKQHQDVTKKQRAINESSFSSSSSSEDQNTSLVGKADDDIHTEAEKMLIKQFNDKIRFGDPNTPIADVTIDNNNNNNNNPNNRRASDSSYIIQQRTGPSSQYHYIKKPTSPSHYKGKRRGTYAAVYDPRVTLARPKSGTRSRSLFIKASDEISSSSSPMTQNDLRIQLLKSFHAKNNLSFSGSENSTSSNDDTASSTHQQEGNIVRALHHRDVTKKSGTHTCSKHHHHHQQHRAHSTIHNLSKDHLKYLEQRYTQAQQHRQRQCVLDDNNNNNAVETTYNEESPSLHGACKIGDFEKIKDMIDAGCNVNQSDSFGRAPCYYAILNGHLDCVSLLVANGANLNDYFQKQKQNYFNNNS